MVCQGYLALNPIFSDRMLRIRLMLNSEVGDYLHEVGIVNKNYQPKSGNAEAGGINPLLACR